MVDIDYTKTTFVKPHPISEDIYNQLKVEFEKNPIYKIGSVDDSFSERFGILFVYIIGGFVIGVILIAIMSSIGKSGSHVPFFMLPACICFLISFFILIRFILEFPSYAKYMKQKQAYFERMKKVIQQTNNYKDFVNLFYSRY